MLRNCQQTLEHGCTITLCWHYTIHEFQIRAQTMVSKGKATDSTAATKNAQKKTV